MNTPIPQRPKRWRRVVLTGASVLLILYVGSYLRFRLSHEIIHTRSFAGDETYHGVRPGSPHGPSIFAAALNSDQLDQLPAIGAAIERRQSFLAVFYAPLGFAEALIWRVIDRIPNDRNAEPCAAANRYGASHRLPPPTSPPAIFPQPVRRASAVAELEVVRRLRAL